MVADAAVSLRVDGALSSPVRLPPVEQQRAVGSGQSQSVVSARLRIESEKAWRRRLFQPLDLLSAADDAAEDCVPVGGPPRVRRRPAVQEAAAAPVAALEDLHQTGSPASSSSSLKPEYRPRLPRVASRRLTSRGQSASTTSNSSRKLALSTPQQPRRPPSAIAVSEVIYTRDIMGPRNLCVWRHDLDKEVKSRDAFSGAFAEYRVDCQRMAQLSSRAQAAHWRETHDREVLLNEMRWRLLQHGSRLGGDEPEDAAIVRCRSVLRHARWQIDQEIGIQASTDAFDDNAPPGRPRFPTPIEPKPGWKRLVSGDEDEIVSSNIATGGPEELNVQQFQDEWWRRRSTMGLLSHPALKPKQPRHVRYSRLEANRRETTRKSQTEAWQRQETPEDKDGLHGDVAVAIKRRFRRTSIDKVIPPPTENDIQNHRVKDVDQMRSVFDIYDRDQSGTLDHLELKGFLREVGLKATTQAERKEIQRVVSVGPAEVTFDEVVTRTVPTVRHIIVEVNRGWIQQMFTEADEDCSGLLSVSELQRILHLIGIYPSQQQIHEALAEFVLVDDIRTISGEVLTTKDILSFANFVRLVPVLQERWKRSRFERAREIAKVYDLERDVLDLWDLEIIDIQNAYERFSSDCSGMLDPSRLQDLVRFSSVFRLRRGLMQNIALLQMTLPGASMIDFSRMLHILSTARRQELVLSKDVFQLHCPSDAQGLSLMACQRALRDLEIDPRSEAEAEEITSLIHEFDEDGSGEVELEEFCRLVDFVSSRLRKLRRDAEMYKAFQHGWTMDDYQELRYAFMLFDEDMSNLLDLDEIVKAVQCIRKVWTEEAVVELLEHMDRNPHKGIDFLGFLDLMKAIEGFDMQRDEAMSIGTTEDVAAVLVMEWRRLQPGMQGKVMKRKVKFLMEEASAELGSEVTFAQYLQGLRPMVATLTKLSCKEERVLHLKRLLSG